MDNNLITQLFTQINKAIDNKLKNLTQIKSAIVHSVNQDGTVNLFIPPDNTVYHNIQNQSIYQNIQSGDSVKIIVENGNLSSMWIIGRFKTLVEPLVEDKIEDKQELNINLNLVYPIGSIYICSNDIDPNSSFGGKWEKMDSADNISMWNRIE